MSFEPARYIEIRESRVVGPKPYIAGTRISVEDIYVCHDLRGMTPDQLVAAYPHISFAQVYAARLIFTTTRARFAGKCKSPKTLRPGRRQSRDRLDLRRYVTA